MQNRGDMLSLFWSFEIYPKDLSKLPGHDSQYALVFLNQYFHDDKFPGKCNFEEVAKLGTTKMLNYYFFFFIKIFI